MSQTQAQQVLDTAVEKQPKKHGCRRGCFGCLGIFILLLPAIWYFCFHTTSLRVSKETTYILSPMTADGKRIDYFLAMEERYYPPEMKTDDNGYRLLVRACGILDGFDEKTKTEEYRQQVYEKLGLDPTIKPTLKLEQPLVSNEQAGQFSQSAMWTLEEYPMLKTWLDENTAGIDLLAEAVRKPAFRMPFVRKNENTPVAESLLLLGEMQIIRFAARSTQARAKYRLGIGNIDGAIDDIVTMYRLARHAGKQGTLMSWLVGIAIERGASAIGIGSNPDFPPTKEQIERLMTEIDALPPQWAWNEVIESERLYALASIQDIHGGNMPMLSDNDEPFPFYRNLLPNMTWTLDINIAMKRVNKIYDDALALSRTIVDEKVLWNKPSPRSNPFNPFPLLFVRSRTNRIMDIITFLDTSAMMYTTQPRSECTLNIKRLTLALLLYEKEHGTLPAGDWREAVKPYLGANPEQYFRCPAGRLAEGETTYAMIEGVTSSAQPNKILLVEVIPPQKLGEGSGRIPLDKAVFSKSEGLGSNHSGGIVTGYRSGGVSLLPENTKPEELRRLY